MNWIFLNSSNISAAAFESNTLYIRFHNGSVYAYPNASKSLFDQLLVAPSKGKFHAQFIKNLPYQRIS